VSHHTRRTYREEIVGIVEVAKAEKVSEKLIEAVARLRVFMNTISLVKSSQGAAQRQASAIKDPVRARIEKEKDILTNSANKDDKTK
jgi:hypothetical protein